MSVQNFQIGFESSCKKIVKHSTFGEFIAMRMQLEQFQSWASSNKDTQVPGCCQNALIKVLDILIES